MKDLARRLLPPTLASSPVSVLSSAFPWIQNIDALQWKLDRGVYTKYTLGMIMTWQRGEEVTVTIDTIPAADGQQTYSLKQWSLGGGSNLFKQKFACAM